MRVAFLLALCVPLWGCSDGSEGLPRGDAPQSAPPPGSSPVVKFDPGGSDPSAAPSGLSGGLLLEKGTMYWPLGVWVDGAPMADGAGPGPTPSADGSVQFSFGTEQHHDEIYTHHHFSPAASGVKSILVRAKASQPLTMLLAITRLNNAFDYWGQLAAGKPWRVADIAVQTEFTDVDIPLESLQPKGPGEPQPLSGTGTEGFLFAFLLTDPGMADIWFERIEMKTAP
jgi:hypothetical protein